MNNQARQSLVLIVMLSIVFSLICAVGARAGVAEGATAPPPDSERTSGACRLQAYAPDPMARQFGDRWNIYLAGEISPDAADLLLGAQREHDIEAGDARVRFDIRGGDREGAMALGRLIRANRWDTGVGRMGEAAYMPEPGQCRGAGLLAYAGGVFRHLDDKSTLLLGPGPLGQAESAYLQEMGIASDLPQRASGLDADAYLSFSTDGWEATGLVNNGRLPAVWRVGTDDMGPYLVGEQVTWRGAGKVVLICLDGRLMLKTMLEAGSQADDVIEHTVSHSIAIDGEFVAAEPAMPPFNIEGWISVMFPVDAEPGGRLAGAKSMGWAGHQMNPAFFVGFEVPTDGYAEVIAGWFADSCGPLRDWTAGEQP